MDMSVFVVKRQFGPLSALLTYMSAKNKTPQQEEARLKQLVQLAAMRSDSDRAQMYLRSTRSTSNLRRNPSDAQKKLNRDTEFLTREISKLEDYKVKQEVRLQEAYRADDEKKRLKAQKNIKGQAEDVENEINKQTDFMEQQDLYFSSSDFIKDMANVLRNDARLKNYVGASLQTFEEKSGAINSGDDLRNYLKNKNQTEKETLNELEAIIAVATGATNDGRLPYKGKQANTIADVKVARFQNEQATVKNLAKAVADEYGLLDFKETKPGTIKKMIIDPEKTTNIENIKAGTKDYTFTIPETSDEERRRRALKATEPIGDRIKELENELAALEKVESADTKQKTTGDDTELDDALDDLEAFYRYGAQPMVNRRPYLTTTVLSAMKKFATKAKPKIQAGVAQAKETISDTLQDAADEDILGMMGDAFDDAVDTVKDRRARRKEEEVEEVTGPFPEGITEEEPFGPVEPEDKTGFRLEDDEVEKVQEKTDDEVKKVQEKTDDEVKKVQKKKKTRSEKPKKTKQDFKPHMMYDPNTGEGIKAETYEEHLDLDKKGYVHDKPEKIESEPPDTRESDPDAPREFPEEEMQEFLSEKETSKTYLSGIESVERANRELFPQPGDKDFMGPYDEDYDFLRDAPDVTIQPSNRPDVKKNLGVKSFKGTKYLVVASYSPSSEKITKYELFDPNTKDPMEATPKGTYSLGEQTQQFKNIHEYIKKQSDESL